MLTLVPWNPQWLQHDSLDLHAIYERPRRDPRTWRLLRDADGFLEYDIAGALPIRSHQRHLMKGFRYITLATERDVRAAAKPGLRVKGVEPLRGEEAYIAQCDYRGPWVLSAYAENVAAARAERLRKIEARIAEAGPDVAEQFEQATDPGYVLPERYRRVTPPVSPPRKRGRPRKVVNPEPAVEAPV